ncbi:trypsin-like serine protease [Comamonas sp. J-3]|uniref:trypsin-like serine protease n=1 Tax=Comamonas trifloxystrobinivorans TaxID=3350256 RepID=UPI00372B9DD6
MSKAPHALRDLVWAGGVAAALALAGCGGGSSSNDDGGDGSATKPTAYYLDSVVLPASAAKSAAAPKALVGNIKTTYIRLPEADTSKAEQAGMAGPRMQIGVPRSVAATSTAAQTQSALQWQTLADGSQAAAINIESGGAYGLRAGVQVESLPDGALLRVYSQEHPNAIVQTSGAEVNALLAQNRKAGASGADANTWWSPDVGAGNATLEVVLPAGTAVSQLRIAIPTISHIYQNLALPTEAEWADSTKAASGSCNLDASCTNNYQTERNAVARMAFTEGGSSYLCTGTLVNNTKGDFKPYLLTANHCISTQSAASTLQTAWFYRSETCNATSPGSNLAVRNGGADLLYATASTDSSFLQLKQMPPAGVTYAGWDARTLSTGLATYGLHHPQGDMLKYSVGSINGYANCVSAGGVSVSCTTGNSDSNFYTVLWSQGVTEMGSSGSSIFSGGRIIGTLYAGSSQCSSAPAFQRDNYGRFDKVFNSKLWTWLAG